MPAALSMKTERKKLGIFRFAGGGMLPGLGSETGYRNFLSIVYFKVFFLRKMA